MRNRMVSTEMLDSRSLGRVSMAAQLMFVLLLMVVDDEGLALYDPPMLCRRLFGNRPEIDEDDLSGWVGELQAEDCVRLYVSEDDRGEEATWISVTNFYYYQTISRPTPSKCPPPPWDHRPDNGGEGKSRIKRRCERLCGKTIENPVENMDSMNTHGVLMAKRKERKRREGKDPSLGSFPFSSAHKENGSAGENPKGSRTHPVPPPRRAMGGM